MTCPKCKSAKCVKNGKRDGLQCYKCKECNFQFVPDKEVIIAASSAGKTGGPKPSTISSKKWLEKNVLRLTVNIRKKVYPDLAIRIERWQEKNPGKSPNQEIEAVLNKYLFIEEKE